MIFNSEQIGKDITVFLTVSGGFMANLSNVNEFLSTLVLVGGLVYTVVRIIGQIKTNKGKELDNERKRRERSTND